MAIYNISDLEQYIIKKQFDHIRILINKLHYVEIAKMIETISSDHILQLIDCICDEIDYRVIRFLPYNLCKYIIEKCSLNRLYGFLDELSDIYKATIISEINRNIILDKIYPAHQIGSIMEKIPCLFIYDTGQIARNKIAQYNIQNIYPVYDEHNTLYIATLDNILHLGDTELIKYDKYDTHILYDTDHIDLLKKDTIFIRNDIEIIGIISEKARLNLVSYQYEKLFIQKISNIASNIIASVISRFRWISITMLNSLFASIVISQFEETLSHSIPIVMSVVAAMGGTTGSQTIAVMIKSLAIHNVTKDNIFSFIRKEGMISGMIGIISGMILGCIIAIWQMNWHLGLVLGSAVFLNMCFAGLIGSTLVIILSHFKLEPTLSASPILNTITDILGYSIFLALATLFLL